MAVAFDSSSESHAGGSGSVSESSFSWTHTPSGTPKGLWVAIMTWANADYISSVTYNGIDIPQFEEAMDTTGEPGRCSLHFLGAGVPTGAQTVQVNRTNNATQMYAIAATVTAGADTEVHVPGIVRFQQDGTYIEQSIDDGSTGVNSMRFAATYSGASTAPTVGANSTGLQSFTDGASSASAVRETTAGQGARPVGWTSPDATLIDDFNRANESPIAAPWAVTRPAPNIGVDLVSNQLQRGASNGLSHWTSATYGDNCRVSATVVTAPTGTDGVSVTARIRDAGTLNVDYYQGTYTNGTGWRIWRVTNNGYAQVGTTAASPTLSNGDSIGMELVGDDIRLMHKTGGAWSVVNSATDTGTSIDPAGFLGVEIVGTAARLDDFRGETLSSRATVHFAIRELAAVARTFGLGTTGAG